MVILFLAEVCARRKSSLVPEIKPELPHFPMTSITTQY